MAPVARIDNGFIKTSFLEAARRKDFQNQWMSSDTWAKLIAKYCITDCTLTYNGTELDKCLNGRQNILLRAQMDLKSNVPKDHLGIFRETLRKHGCKVSYYYYATESGHLPFNTEAKWHENISDAKELLDKVLTRAHSNSATISLSNGLEQTKKRKLSETFGLQTSEAPVPENESPNGTILMVQPSSFIHHRPSYWDSPEVMKLSNTLDDEENARQSVSRQIEILMKGNKTEDSYLDVIYGDATMDSSTLSSFEKHQIRLKCQLLCMSLNLALENINDWTWNRCCSEAIAIGIKMGISTVKNPKTIEKWYRGFRAKRCFCIPLKKKHNLPPFLELNPDVCTAIKEYGKCNLGIMSVEMMSLYLHTVIIPQMIEKEVREEEIALDASGNESKVQALQWQILHTYSIPEGGHGREKLLTQTPPLSKNYSKRDSALTYVLVVQTESRP